MCYFKSIMCYFKSVIGEIERNSIIVRKLSIIGKVLQTTTCSIYHILSRHSNLWPDIGSFDLKMSDGRLLY